MDPHVECIQYLGTFNLLSHTRCSSLSLQPYNLDRGRETHRVSGFVDLRGVHR